MLFDYNFKRYNFRILIYVILLSGIGVMAIWSATNQDRSMIAKQIFGIILGLILAICLSLVDYTTSYGTDCRRSDQMADPSSDRSDSASRICKNRTDSVLFLVFSKISGKDQSAHYPGSWSCTVRASCLYDFGAAKPFHNSGYYGDHCVGCILFRCQLQVDFRSSGSAVSPWSGVCIHAPV